MDISYWLLRGTIEENKDKLNKKSKNELISLVINERYNSFCKKWCDKDPERVGEKCIPYLGWFWRPVDFANKIIPFGFDEDYQGVMVSNKWDCDERNLIPEEAEIFISYIEKAMREDEKGGDFIEIYNNVMIIFSELRDWVKSLER